MITLFSPRTSVPCALLVVAALATASPASAQDPAPAAPAPAPAPAPATAPVLVPPQIQGSPEVAYPVGGVGDAEVILALTVQKDGSVKAVEVVQGNEPFASAAKNAAMSFRFQPGTRNGEPVAAKIRFAVTFKQTKVETPVPEEPETPSANPQNTEPKKPGEVKPKPAKPDAITVDVRGEKPAPAVSTLSRAEVRQIPGTFGDPFRALEVLPGVTPIVSGLPYFYVRGAPPGNVGYYLDGIRVPYLFHVGVGPSVVNPSMVERVNLHSGGYPSEFGRYAGAIVTADLTTPRVDLHGEGVFRIFDAGATAETGFAGGRGSAMLGGRFSFTSMILSLLSPNVGLAYRDYQARVTYDLTPRDRISLISFGAYDLLKDTTNGVETIVFGSEFYRLDLRYQRLLPNDGVLKWGTTLGYDQSRLGEQRNAQDKLFATRVFLTQPLHPKLTLKAGLDAQFDHYTADKRHWADPDDPDTIAYDNLFPPRDDEAFGAYADIDWQIDPRVKITPGVRLDVFTSGGSHATSVSPRLSVTAQVHKKIRLLHAFGLATQPPAFVLPLPGLSIGQLAGGLQTSVQSSFGIEAQLPLSITATVSVFDNVFLNMSDTLSVQRPGQAFESDPRSLGYSRGLEVYARTRFTQKLGGFVSYTLSESIRKIGESTFPSAFDRRHVLNAALGYTLPLKIRAGARVTFYTGAPDVSGPTATAPTDPLNPPRNPSFFRLDLRLEKKWEYRNQRWLSLVIEMINSTLSKEVISGQEIGPISIPSIGAEGGF